jgi:chromosome segregation ATPase
MRVKTKAMLVAECDAALRDRDEWRSDTFKASSERDKLRSLKEEAERKISALERRLEAGDVQLKAVEKQRDSLAWYICQHVLHLDPKA